jgi:hypothetical protein
MVDEKPVEAKEAPADLSSEASAKEESQADPVPAEVADEPKEEAQQ